MRHWQRHIVVSLGILVCLRALPVQAQEAAVLKPAVLVLPLQTSDEAGEDIIAFGWAVHNVLENVLALHSDLEDCWVNWFLRQLFPQQQDLNAWLRGHGDLPAAVEALGFRYLLTGQVRQQGEEIQVTLVLRDRATEHQWSRTLAVDLPRLTGVRQDFLALLAQAGVPAPEAQQPKMLWHEELPRTAFILLGQGIQHYYAEAVHYTAEQSLSDSGPLQEGLQHAPQSYLLLNTLGWVLYEHQHYAEALRRFTQALDRNPAGVDAADGVMQGGIRTGDAELAKRGAMRKAQLQGRLAWEHHLGTGYMRAERFAEGQQVLESALTAFAPSERQDTLRIALADLHFAWAQSLAQRLAYQEAIPHYQAALAIDERLRRRNAVIDLTWLGNAYQALRQHEQAIIAYEQALAIAREVGMQMGEWTILHNLGLVYKDLYQHQRAMTYFEQALASYKQALVIMHTVGSRAGKGTTLHNLGDVFLELGQYEQALTSLKEALAIRREVGDRVGEGATLHSLGLAYIDLRQYEQALTSLKEALAIRREVGDRVGEEATLYELGTVSQNLSHYGLALASYEQSLAIAREVEYRGGEAAALSNLGLVYQELSQYERAINYYEQALKIWRKIGERVHEGETLNRLGLAYWSLRHYEQAINYYEQALKILREVGERQKERVTLHNLGMAYGSLRQYRQALAFLEEALATAREVGDRAGEGTTLTNLGSVHLELRQYGSALAFLEEALTIHREVGNRGREGNTAAHLMYVWKAQQKPNLAIFYGKQAVNVFQAIRGGIQTLDKTLQQSFLTSREDVYRTLAGLLINAGRLPEAQQVLNLLKDEEYFDFVRRNAAVARLQSRQLEMNPEEASWQPRDDAMVPSLTALGRELSTLRAKRPRTTEEEARLTQLQNDLTIARERYLAFLKELRVALGDTPLAYDKVSHLKGDLAGVMKLLKQLGPGIVHLQTFVTDEMYYAIVTTPEVQVSVPYAITAAALRCKVFALREALQNPAVDPRPVAHELYQILVGPVIQSLLEGVQAQTLLLVLDDVLRYVPFSALYDGTQYLIERYRTVVITPSIAIDLTKTPRQTWQGLGLGVSKAHDTFSALAGVPMELRGIIRDATYDADGVLPGTIKLDDAFTAQAMFEALRQCAPDQCYPVVHIASHFQFRPGNETDSFLLLGDGSRLSLAEINASPEQVFGGVELLTLSACDTAMGDAGTTGKEVEGFGVLAQQQGAQAVLATLWPIADTSTKDLMQTFYRLRESQPGLPKVEALRQAQLALLHGQGLPTPGLQVAALDPPTAAEGSGATALRGLDLTVLEEARKRCGRAEAPAGCVDITQQPCFTPTSQAPYAHPYYWAPFILIGNWK